jgi:glycosyltransferase involved in cell wall biosynthesis
LIYICIPAYNEAATVGVLLWKIRRVMSDFPRDYEILVLDDGSTDGTQDVLAPYARVLPVTVLRHEERRGYAAALERLIREAVGRATHPKRDMVVTLQADFTEAPEDIPALIRRLEGGADIVEATVTTEGMEAPRARRWSRRGLPWLLRGTRLPEGVRDPLSGFRAYRAFVLKKAVAQANGAPLLTTEGWAANVELLFAVAPHARRADSTEVARRYDRRQRETRFRAWDTAVDLWSVIRHRQREAPAAAAPETLGSP